MSWHFIRQRHADYRALIVTKSPTVLSWQKTIKKHLRWFSSGDILVLERQFISESPHCFLCRSVNLA